MKRLSFLVAAVAALPFLPALRNGFVDWDDAAFIVKNAALARFDVSWMLTSRLAGHYHPLTWLSLALDRAVYGTQAWGFHLTSILLHAAAAALFFRVARRLLPGKDPAWPAAFAALVFALHPLRVESVAWAIERRDVLSGVFYLWAFDLWLRDEPRAAFAAFAASLLSKGIAVTLPAALALVDVAARGRRLDAAWLKKAAPFFALSAGLGLFGLRTANMDAAIPLATRAAVALHGLCFYPLKTLWPSGLIPLYPWPTGASLAQWPYWACAVAAGAAAAATAALWRRAPRLAACAAFYALTIFPVLGVFRFGPQSVADRYSYLACLPLALLAGEALRRAQADRRWKACAAPAAAAVLLVLAALTARQVRFWESGRTLWTRELALRPDVPLAHHLLASAALSRRDPLQAERRERAALALEPSYAPALNGLGLALAAQRRFEAALAQYDAAVAAQPDYWEAQNNKGLALAHLRRFDESRAVFERALARHPEVAGLHGNFALALLTAGDRQRGVAELETALRLDPDQPNLLAIRARLR
jgi:protein O-mannosyl-transferase